MLKIVMSAPERADELELARRMLGNTAPEVTLSAGGVQAVLQAEVLPAMKQALLGVVMRDELVAYLVDLVRATRTEESVLVGAGPRATQSLLLASRAHAALAGRDYVTPDDIKALAAPVLGHRIILRPEFEIEGLTVEEALQRIAEKVAVPR
jgi:MoxR-like ATPase